MKLSYITPDYQYEFFREIIPELVSLGVQVYLNDIRDDTDIILAAILPVSHEWLLPLETTDKPYVLWHWDLYSFTYYDEDRWARFLRLLPTADDIWSCSYEVARELKEHKGLDSYMMPAWVDSDRLPPSPKIDHNVLFASSGGGFGKRIDWAERACKILYYPLKLLTGQALDRSSYYNTVRECRVYLMPAFEESNATIPAMEAGAAGRPVVISDLPSSREVFGDTAFYFAPNDFRGLLAALKKAWDSPDHQGRCASRIRRLFDLRDVAERMVSRLREVLSCVHA